MHKSYNLKSNKVTAYVTTTQVKKKDNISQCLKSLFVRRLLFLKV